MHHYSFITKHSAFSIINFGKFYFPDDSLQKNLRQVIIFAENTKKHNIPNGSVFVYDKNTEYNPEILKSDVGCGITAFFMEPIAFDEKSKMEILKAIDSLGIHIGQGNHFLDFTINHPSIRKGSEKEPMLTFLHTDFNNENYLPTTFDEAKELELKAKDGRISYLEKLAKTLGLKYEFYQDWTHNSVNTENGFLIYRKGAINLNETDNLGLLALNPLDGLYLYVAEFKEYFNSMQHGTGKSKDKDFEIKEKFSYGIARGFSFEELVADEEAFKKAYRSIDDFLENFWDLHKPIGYCIPDFVVLTKGCND